jgi:hypothetical protein
MHFNKKASIALITSAFLILPAFTFAAVPAEIPLIFGIRLEFIIFALTLVGVAVFHHKTMIVALTGLAAILLFLTIHFSSILPERMTWKVNGAHCLT